MEQCPRYRKGKPADLVCAPDQSVFDVLTHMSIKRKYEHVLMDFMYARCEHCCHEANIPYIRM